MTTIEEGQPLPSLILQAPDATLEYGQTRPGRPGRGSRRSIAYSSAAGMEAAD